jgi:hypothetical protein
MWNKTFVLSVSRSWRGGVEGWLPKKRQSQTWVIHGRPTEAACAEVGMVDVSVGVYRMAKVSVKGTASEGPAERG